MSFLSSYAIPVHARRVVITHQDDLKDGDRRREEEGEEGRRGRRGRGVQLDESLRIGDIQPDCKFNQEVWLSLFERSLMTPVDAIICINNVWKSAD